jgi:hypothetical protein
MFAFKLVTPWPDRLIRAVRCLAGPARRHLARNNQVSANFRGQD